MYLQSVSDGVETVHDLPGPQGHIGVAVGTKHSAVNSRRPGRCMVCLGQRLGSCVPKWIFLRVSSCRGWRVRKALCRIRMLYCPDFCGANENSLLTVELQRTIMYICPISGPERLGPSRLFREKFSQLVKFVLLPCTAGTTMLCGWR